MPKQTRETSLPKPPPAPVDWVKIAESGRVWEFVEGDDFTGQASSFRARAKTAARKLGVDFESAEVQRGGKAVLKILARMMPARRASAAGWREGAGDAADEPGGRDDLAAAGRARQRKPARGRRTRNKKGPPSMAGPLVMERRL